MTFAEAPGGDMKIGIGLPNALPAVDGRALLDWARRDEDRGFSTLATIDRLVYDSYDPLTVLAAAAAVTTCRLRPRHRGMESGRPRRHPPTAGLRQLRTRPDRPGRRRRPSAPLLPVPRPPSRPGRR